MYLVFADFVSVFYRPFWQFLSKIFSTTTLTEGCCGNTRADT